jgi:hypothetical protein
VRKDPQNNVGKKREPMAFFIEEDELVLPRQLPATSQIANVLPDAVTVTADCLPLGVNVTFKIKNMV